jgi:hypothetical protein
MEEYYNEPIRVYVKLNSYNEIIDIGSSIFINDTYEWVMIDSGYGDKYAHAQTQYLPSPLKKRNGTYRYIYENGKIMER